MRGGGKRKCLIHFWVIFQNHRRVKQNKMMTNFSSKCHSVGVAVVPRAVNRVKSMPEMNETSQTDGIKERK